MPVSPARHFKCLVSTNFTTRAALAIMAHSPARCGTSLAITPGLAQGRCAYDARRTAAAVQLSRFFRRAAALGTNVSRFLRGASRLTDGAPIYNALAFAR